MREVCLSVPKGSFIKYKRKIYLETKIFYPLIRAPTCAYKEVRNVSFSEIIATVLSETVLKMTTKNNENLHSLICLFFLFSVVTHSFVFFNFSSFS